MAETNIEYQANQAKIEQSAQEIVHGKHGSHWRDIQAVRRQEAAKLVAKREKDMWMDWAPTKLGEYVRMTQLQGYGKGDVDLDAEEKKFQALLEEEAKARAAIEEPANSDDDMPPQE